MSNTNFAISEQAAAKAKATFTINEICQQPAVWSKLEALVNANKEKIDDFFTRVNAEHAQFVFTGSGTSGFVGDSLAAHLTKYNVNAVAVHGTSIVSDPTIYFKENQPAVLVSFARSGNSPESVASVELFKQIVKSNYQIIITCNENGHLYQTFKDDKRALVLLMPSETDDKSFAMTSSYSSMLLTALLIFSMKNKNIMDDYHRLLNNAKTMLTHDFAKVQEIAKQGYERVVYLGSNILYGFSEECALKVLELTAGKVASVYNSCLGFRHGPKSIVNNKTLIVVMISSDPYTRQYDIDLLKEVFHDKVCQTVVCLDNGNDASVSQYCHHYFATSSDGAVKHDIVLGLQYVVWGQMFGLFKSLELNNTPDNPCPTGEVNRVVKGVIIHSFSK